MSIDSPHQVSTAVPIQSADQSSDPFAGILPGAAKPYYLEKGEGEKSVVFDTLFTILLTGDETDGQYDVFTTEGGAGDIIPAHLHPVTHEIFFILDGAVHLWMDDEKGNKTDRVLQQGAFGYVPMGTIHAFRIESTAKVLGVSSGGFARFFHDMGTPTEKAGIPQPSEFYAPSIQQMMAAGQKYGTIFRPDYKFLD
ncbi:quercetin 2,3-dioxygenase [Naasia lichenicola]|uniref:Cupin domain-containing protein n=1 Tax=Naasia lichenicola TaxID=2565933 RepID=A0A4S4FMY9_9MICO|nr:quercetin 2,3-dioxygenase [Naasia lichenicola]THG31618.1 cupin domain-containing protein [Naasia lichenicola]